MNKVYQILNQFCETVSVEEFEELSVEMDEEQREKEIYAWMKDNMDISENHDSFFEED